MADIPRMNDDQFREARKLIRKRCCNYDNGNCLALDDGIYPICAQWNSCSLICKWFRKAVLPNDRILEESILRTQKKRRCVICGNPLSSDDPRTKYCPDCAITQQREKTRKRVRRYRGKL